MTFAPRSASASMPAARVCPVSSLSLAASPLIGSEPKAVFSDPATSPATIGALRSASASPLARPPPIVPSLLRTSAMLIEPHSVRSPGASLGAPAALAPPCDSTTTPPFPRTAHARRGSGGDYRGGDEFGRRPAPCAQPGRRGFSLPVDGSPLSPDRRAAPTAAPPRSPTPTATGTPRRSARDRRR